MSVDPYYLFLFVDLGVLLGLAGLIWKISGWKTGLMAFTFREQQGCRAL